MALTQREIDLGRAAARLLDDEAYVLVTTTLLARCHSQIFNTDAADDAQRKHIWDRYKAFGDIEAELQRLRAIAQDYAEAIDSDELPEFLGLDFDDDPDEELDDQ